MTPIDINLILRCFEDGRDEIEASFRRTFEKFGKSGEFTVQPWREGLQACPTGRGLVIRFAVADRGVLLVVPDPGELIPAWADSPDPTGAAKLATLAQELAILLFPPEWTVGEASASVVPSVLEAVESAQPTDATVAAIVAITQSDGTRGSLWLIAPIASPRQSDGSESPSGVRNTTTHPSPSSKPASASHQDGGTRDILLGEPAVQRPRVIPLLTRSLLRIRLPLEVTLAETKKPLEEILQLCPGATIQFEKSCEEPLELCINGRVIAKGEAVKVGDKFGLRILEMVPPPERYIVLGPKTASGQ